MDADQIWEDLRLGQLLGADPEGQLPLALQAALGNSGKKSKESIKLEHDKTWRKPAYNVLKDRYSSKPHDPPVLNASKLTKLADPLRGKFASSYDKFMLGEDDEDEEDGDETGGGIRQGQRGNYRYKNATMEETPQAKQRQRQASRLPNSATKRLHQPTSPARDKDTRASAFFLTAAGSDDGGDDDINMFAAAKRLRGGGVSSFRNKLEEAKRGGGRNGLLKDKLSKPLLDQQKRRLKPGQHHQQQQQQQQQHHQTMPLGLQRKKSGKFATAGVVLGSQQHQQQRGRGGNSIKTSIPPQQPAPRRKPTPKIFDAGSMWNTTRGGGRLGGSGSRQQGGKATTRRGTAPVDQPLGVGLDLSNASSNGGGGGGGLAERRAQRLARAKVSLTGAPRTLTGEQPGGVAATMQSKDTSDVPSNMAAGGGVNAAARIRAARAGGIGVVKSAPGHLPSEQRWGTGRPVPPSVLKNKEAVAAAASALALNSAAAPRNKSVTIDPSLSPLPAERRGLSAKAGMGNRSVSSREISSSPRGSSKQQESMMRSNSHNSNAAATTSNPSSPRNSSAAAAPVDMRALRNNLEKIQAKETERVGAKEADSSAAALLMQHAKRLSSQFDKAKAMTDKYYSSIEDDGKSADYSWALGTKGNKIVI